MITLRAYKVEDWSMITDSVEPFSPLMPTEEFLDMVKNGVAVTGIENDVVMACGGITYTSEDAGIVWVKVSEKCQGYGWARTIRETFRIMMEIIGSLRISTYILNGFFKGEKLAKLIGLEKTSETEKYKGNIYNKYTAVI